MEKVQSLSPEWGRPGRSINGDKSILFLPPVPCPSTGLMHSQFGNNLLGIIVRLRRTCKYFLETLFSGKMLTSEREEHIKEDTAPMYVSTFGFAKSYYFGRCCSVRLNIFCMI